MDIETLFKTQSSRILSALIRIFGAHNIDLAEEAMQETFAKAIEVWKDSPPSNPEAWITRSAKNRAIDIIRSRRTQTKFAEDLTYHLESEWSLGRVVEQEFQESKLKDDLLQMIFMCCRPHIKPENRIPFILKSLCGFSIEAVARALVLQPETVKKRLARTREGLKNEKFGWPPQDEMEQAMDSVHTIIYLIFNEGFHCSDSKQATKLQLCHEAMGLLRLLVEEPKVVNQETFALYSLMTFHMGRFKAKTNQEGLNIPIDLQDRNLWDPVCFEKASYWLGFSKSMAPDFPGRFLIEAQIAQEHCLAKSFEETAWDKIESFYKQLASLTNSPVAYLNQAIATGYRGQLDIAIEQVKELRQQKPLNKSHMPLSILAHFYAKKGDRKKAYHYAIESKKMGGTPYEQKAMLEQIERMLPPLKT